MDIFRTTVPVSLLNISESAHSTAVVCQFLLSMRFYVLTRVESDFDENLSMVERLWQGNDEYMWRLQSWCVCADCDDE